MPATSYASGALKDAREAALKDRHYDSEGTRQTMSQKLQDVFDGRVPYDWQLDAAEALILQWLKKLSQCLAILER